MSFSDKVIEILNQPLKVYQRPTGTGKSYPYVKGEDVVKQLNKAFGHAWSSQVLTQTEVHDQVLVSVELSVIHEGQKIFHHGYGSAPVAKTKDGGKVIDIGNCYKSAYTSALKKAAEAFGIGLGGEDEDGASPQQNARPYTKSAYSPPARPTSPPPSSPRSEAPKEAIKSSPSPQASSLVSNTQKVSDVQKRALVNLSKMRQIPEGELVKKALPDANKASFDDLTQSEAVDVIKYANTAHTKSK